MTIIQKTIEELLQEQYIELIPPLNINKPSSVWESQSGYLRNDGITIISTNQQGQLSTQFIQYELPNWYKN
jgi:hypothetical protein